MNKKNPCDYMNGILQILASDKKRIGFLCGAGTSYAGKSRSAIYIPNMNEITNKLLEEIPKKNIKFGKAVNDIIIEIVDYNLEKILDLIEKKIDAVGKSELNGLNFKDFKELKEIINSIIFESVSKVSISTPLNDLKKLPHYELVKWIGKIERKYPIEIFTTNYDYLFESTLEANEIPYYDGFTGSLNPFFNALSIEDFTYLPKETKLWKLHGSLGWKMLDNKVVSCKMDPNNKNLLIFPSSLKYLNSKKMPYISLIDRLCNFLEQEDSILFIIGYSFSDEHINERIITSLKKARNSHVYALVYDKICKDEVESYHITDEKFMTISNQTSRISFIGMINIIIGGKIFNWDYMDDKSNDGEDLKKYMKFNDDNSFKELLLPDFSVFVDFITSLISDVSHGE